MDFFVGTFNTPHIYTLRFTPPDSSRSASLTILQRSAAIGSHSWLALSPSKTHLYATAWTDPPSVAAYRIPSDPSTTPLTLLNTAPTSSRSGYVCCSTTHLYSAGGPSGEVFTLNPDGSIGPLIQRLSFIPNQPSSTSTSPDSAATVPHGDFGGLRHGAHSADLSPDGKSLYIADIGRNCIWSFSINPSTSPSTPHLTSQTAHPAPRPTDGPRHTTPHPNGQILYSLQEHTSLVDVFTLSSSPSSSSPQPKPLKLTHTSFSLPTIPTSHSPSDYWADEVRLSHPTHSLPSSSSTSSPRYLYASTRALHPPNRGHIAVYALSPDGLPSFTPNNPTPNNPLDPTTSGNNAQPEPKPIHIYETRTSGGWANAVEPAPRYPYPTTDGEREPGGGGVEYLALTDSEEGWVVVLGFDGVEVREVAGVQLEWEGEDEGQGERKGGVVGAATAVWL
ncbi:MAG: hypothetical protein Q9227_007623 [Pyrenula ochraceoflavens]